MRKSYEGQISFIEQKDFESVEQVIFTEAKNRVKFDCKWGGILYTVDISKKDNGYWGGKYSYWYEKKLIEEELDNCEVFKRADGSYLVYGWWIEDRIRYTFCVEFYEA